jgi:signal peptidase I
MDSTSPPPPQPKQHALKDLGQLVLFAVGVLIGAVLINTFIFQSFTVSGHSMDTTLADNDRLIVNRIPVTWNAILNKQYMPDRGQIIIFRNPLLEQASTEEYVVKRVIAFPGERVVLKDGHYTVYNSDRPNGFNPDNLDATKPGSPTVGELDVTVPAGTLFVSGDHRQLNTQTGVPYSLDSRNGLGYIPLENIVGPVGMRIYPVQSITTSF